MRVEANTRTIPIELIEALADWEERQGPLHRRLATALAVGIENGRLLPGSRLPPERALAARLGVGRGTVGAAYALLRDSALVDRRQGRGTEVSSRDVTAAPGRVAELATSLQRNLLFRSLAEPSGDTLDLVASCAAPSPVVRRAIAAAIAAIDVDALANDNGYFPLGYPELRRAVARYLGTLGLPTSEEEILVTGGAQHALTLVAASYLKPGQLVVVEDPTFPGAVDAFRTAGARIVTIPVAENGADLASLRAALAQGSTRVAYLMPSFHNPTGALMPEREREDVARLSRATGVPVIDDLTLGDLALGTEPPPPIAAFAPNAPVITLGSLSKLYWGGLRVGWIRAPRSMISQLGRVKTVSDLGTSLLSQVVAAQLLADVPIAKEVRRRELGQRLVLLERLRERLLPEWRWLRPHGGLSVWAQLPRGSASEFASFAVRHGVSIVPGPVMSATGSFDMFVRLPFDHEKRVLSEGISRLAAAWDAYSEYLERTPQRLAVVV